MLKGAKRAKQYLKRTDLLLKNKISCCAYTIKKMLEDINSKYC